MAKSETQGPSPEEIGVSEEPQKEEEKTEVEKQRKPGSDIDKDTVNKVIDRIKDL